MTSSSPTAGQPGDAPRDSDGDSAGDSAGDTAGDSVREAQEHMRRAKIRGLFWIFAASVFVTAMAVLIKYLGRQLPVQEIVGVRAVFLVAFILPFVLRRGPAGLRATQPGLLVVRTLIMTLINVLGFWVLTVLPLVYVTSISFSKPLWVTVLAALLIGERVRLRRSLATAVGFIGVLVMVNPFALGGEELSLTAALAAVFVAFLMGLSVIMIKELARNDHWATVIFYPNLGVLLILLPWMAYSWVTPTWDQAFLLAALGAVGLLAQTCFLRAYEHAEAGFIAPFEYLRILLAAAAGFWIFAEVPDIWTAVGAVIIVSSTFYIAQREARLGRRQRKAAAEEG